MTAASPRPLTSASRAGGDHLGEGAELREQFLGERLHIALWDRAKQDQLEKLIVADGIAPGLQKALAQARPMAVVVRRLFGFLRALVIIAKRHDRTRLAPALSALVCRMPIMSRIATRLPLVIKIDGRYLSSSLDAAK